MVIAPLSVDPNLANVELTVRVQFNRSCHIIPIKVRRILLAQTHPPTQPCIHYYYVFLEILLVESSMIIKLPPRLCSQIRVCARCRVFCLDFGSFPHPWGSVWLLPRGPIRALFAGLERKGAKLSKNPPVVCFRDDAERSAPCSAVARLAGFQRAAGKRLGCCAMDRSRQVVCRRVLMYDPVLEHPSVLSNRAERRWWWCRWCRRWCGWCRRARDLPRAVIWPDVGTDAPNGKQLRFVSFAARHAVAHICWGRLADQPPRKVIALQWRWCRRWSRRWRRRWGRHRAKAVPHDGAVLSSGVHRHVQMLKLTVIFPVAVRRCIRQRCA